MAQYYEDFRESVLDSVPSDFTLAWGGPPLIFEIKSGNILPDSDQHLLLTTTGSDFQRLALRWDVGLTEGKTTVRCLLEFDPLVGTTTRGIPGAFLSGSGNQSARTGYVQWFGASNRLSKYNAGADSAVATETIPLSAGVTTRYLEIVRDGSTIETRQWLYGTARPGTPDLSFTDGSPLPVGGFFGLSYLPGGAVVPIKLLSIAAGTNGDPAPTEPVDDGIDVSITATESGYDVASVDINNAIQLGISASETGQDSAAVSLDNHINLSITAIEPGSDTASVTLNNTTGVEVIAQESGYDTASITLGVTQDVSISITAQEQGADTAQIIIIAGQIYVIPDGCASIEDVTPVYSIEDASPLYSIEDVTCQLV